jgi:hypothetical protein
VSSWWAHARQEEGREAGTIVGTVPWWWNGRRAKPFSTHAGPRNIADRNRQRCVRGWLAHRGGRIVVCRQPILPCPAVPMISMAQQVALLAG